MLFYILLPIFMLLTVIALGYGLFTMVKGGHYTGESANKAMCWRIGLQGAAIAIAMIILLVMDK